MLIVEWNKIVQGDKRYVERNVWGGQYDLWFGERKNSIQINMHQRRKLKETETQEKENVQDSQKKSKRSENVGKAIRLEGDSNYRIMRWSIHSYINASMKLVGEYVIVEDHNIINASDRWYLIIINTIHLLFFHFNKAK